MDVMEGRESERLEVFIHMRITEWKLMHLHLMYGEKVIKSGRLWVRLCKSGRDGN